ncbi:hypothetical protein Y958_20520 [Nitrospirillum viridazoti CBAmc]|uniref:Uncharacterized protein n=2 Tax=Azospirillaceae TaxID=2829815 RepID=A0A248JYJ2_9PROT|nr:hypothetical protein Y958_20520 [Nitrospirillum amazonense CBAmc]
MEDAMSEKAPGFWHDLLIEEIVEGLEWARSPLPVLIPPVEQLADVAEGMVPISLKRRPNVHVDLSALVGLKTAANPTAPRH